MIDVEKLVDINVRHSYVEKSIIIKSLLNIIDKNEKLPTS